MGARLVHLWGQDGRHSNCTDTAGWTNALVEACGCSPPIVPVFSLRYGAKSLVKRDGGESCETLEGSSPVKPSGTPACGRLTLLIVAVLVIATAITTAGITICF